MISVIVPVYNVEKYLNRCIESILAQTYKDFELILIDDGSTDLSGKICDDYSTKDTRIRVIHQENKGLAEVRNVGINAVRGEYIVFVDSDDWIESELLEIALKYAELCDSDIVCYKVRRVYEDGTIDHNRNKRYEPITMNMEEALSVIFFPQYVDVMSCNKLIKKSLLSDIHYPTGKLYEDMYTTYKIIAKAQRITCIDNELYNYYQNRQSIGHYKFSEKTYDLGLAADECCNYALTIPDVDEVCLLVGDWFWKLVVVNQMIKSSSINSVYVKELQDEMRNSYILRCRLLDPVRKLQMMMFKMCFPLYIRLYGVKKGF